jgi:hypothetical protein
MKKEVHSPRHLSQRTTENVLRAGNSTTKKRKVESLNLRTLFTNLNNLTLIFKAMSTKDNRISITVDWDLEYDESSLNERIEDAIIRKATDSYIVNVEKNFRQKLETSILDQVQKIVKGINRIELDQCNKSGIKEVISMEDYIIKKAIEALDKKTDQYGRDDYNSRDEKRTAIGWVVKDIITSKEQQFQKELRVQIGKIEAEFQKTLQEMVTKTLTPIYTKLVEKLNG